jgi:hypothetical protein
MVNVKYNGKYYKLESGNIFSSFDFSVIMVFRYDNNIYNIRNFINRHNSLIIMNLKYKIEYGFIIRKKIK